MTPSEIEQRVFEIIRTRNPNVDPASTQGMPLDQLGIDSIELLNIVFEIEEEFGISIPDDDLRSLQTTDDLHRLVHTRLAPRASGA